MTRVARLAAFMGCLCVGVLAVHAQTSVPQDRPAPGQPAPPSDAPLLLRYKISQYDHNTKSYSKVDLDKVFQKGDEIIVEIEATEDSFLYVVNEDLNKKVTWILPAADRPEESNLLKGGVSVRIPAHKNMYFQNDGPGTETVFFLLSRTPQAAAVIERLAVPDSSHGAQPLIMAQSTLGPQETNPAQVPQTIKKTFFDRLMRRHPQATSGQSADNVDAPQSASLYSDRHSPDVLQRDLPRSLGVIEADHENSFAYVANASGSTSYRAPNDVVMWEVKLKQR